nr:retrotransposon Orf1 [Tanacetum cinerariifolium]
MSNFMASQDARLSKFEADFKQQQSEMTNKIDVVLMAITDRITRALPSDTVKKPKLNVKFTSLVSSSHSYSTLDPQCSTQIYDSINAITICPKRPGKSQTDKAEEEEQDDKDNSENINTNPSSPTDPSVSFITEKIMKRKLDPKENINGGVNNFTGRIKEMHIFVENFTYVIDFMIVEDISSIIGPKLSQVILGKPFIKISNMTHGPPDGVVRFTNGIDEIAYKMPHKIEHYNSLSDIEREHTKSVYLRNEEDKR